MIDLGHIKINVGPLWRVWHHKQVDSFWIHFVRNHFVPSCVNLLFATWMTWTGVMVWELLHTKANSSQINSSKLRPVWSWSVCLCIVWILYFTLNQWRYNKTIEPFHGKTYDLVKILDFNFFAQTLSSYFLWSFTEMLGHRADLLQRYDVINISDNVKILS